MQNIPNKEELLDKYEAGLDAPYEDLSDIDNLSDEEQSAMITEHKKRISNVYNKIQKGRVDADDTLYFWLIFIIQFN